jgi:hypothetical protein
LKGWKCPLSLFLLKHSLLSLQGVQQPCEGPLPWTLLYSRTQRSSLCAHRHLLNALLAELYRILSDSISFLNSNQSSPPQCNPCIYSMPTWQSFSRVLSVTLFPLMNSTRVLFCTQCACSMPSWQSYTELLRDSVFCCAFLCTVLPPRYLVTLRFLLEPMTSAGAPPGTSLPKFHRIQECIYALAFRTRSILSHPLGMKPQRTPNLKSKNPR